MWRKLLGALPRGADLDEADWQRRHHMLLWVLAVHIPGLAVFGLLLGYTPLTVATVVVVAPAVCIGLGLLLRQHRRAASVTVTAGLAYCSAALVGLSHGSIEAHFHFFIIIGFIALYHDWAPFLFNILFTVISHGIGSVWQQSLIFSTVAGQSNPWLWSLIHGVAVLFACVGIMLFWRVTEDQYDRDALSRQLAEAETDRQRFTSDLLTNLARRNQSLLHRQLNIINQLEESEQDPDALAELFTLDHLATRVRRNAENLLVLSGEQPPRTWSEPVPLRDILRAAIAETENLDRVVFVVDERPAVAGHTVTDLTHLIAELTENAIRFSPPDTTVTIRARPVRRNAGGYLITVEDWGVGMPPDNMAAANTLLANPPEVDLSVSQRLGFHVVARLAARHGVEVSLGPTPGSGITAVVTLPATLFVRPAADTALPAPAAPAAPVRHADGPRPTAGQASQQWAPVAVPPPREGPLHGGPVPAGAPHPSVAQQINTPFGAGGDQQWTGWWSPDAQPAAMVVGDDMAVFSPSSYLPASAQATPAPPSLARAAPSPTPRPAPAADRPETPHTPEVVPGGLRRRVPQTHLNAQLRQPGPDTGPAAGPASRTTADAASALSRYQASRAAAQAATENGGAS